MNILYAIENLSPKLISGVAVFTRRMAEEMVRRGHRVSIVTASPNFRNHVQKDNGITFYRFRSFPTILEPSTRTGTLTGIFNRKGIKKLIKEIRPDIVHVQNFFSIGPFVLDAAVKQKIPCIGTNHTMAINIACFFPNFTRKRVDKFIWKRMVRAFKKCAYLTAPSQFAFSVFAKHSVRVPGEVVSNGIDLNKFSPIKSGKDLLLKNKYSLPDKPIVLYAGRLDPGKEMEVLVKSIPYVLEKVDAHFVILGRGKKKKTLQKLSKSLGIETNMSFINTVPYAEMPDFYRLANLFAISSYFETQSLVVLEAMASGLPIVATNFAALPELVKDGENGFLFDVGDSRMMGKKIAKILSDHDLAKSMREKSLALVKGHNIQKTFDAFESIYKRLASGKYL